MIRGLPLVFLRGFNDSHSPEIPNTNECVKWFDTILFAFVDSMHPL